MANSHKSLSTSSVSLLSVLKCVLLSLTGGFSYHYHTALFSFKNGWRGNTECNVECKIISDIKKQFCFEVLKKKTMKPLETKPGKTAAEPG